MQFPSIFQNIRIVQTVLEHDIHTARLFPLPRLNRATSGGDTRLLVRPCYIRSRKAAVGFMETVSRPGRSICGHRTQDTPVSRARKSVFRRSYPHSVLHTVGPYCSSKHDARDCPPKHRARGLRAGKSKLRVGPDKRKVEPECSFHSLQLAWLQSSKKIEVV